jgi:L-malate glycosyltransferase
MKRVLILYHYMPQWRRDFFDRLRGVLAGRDIALDLIYGRLKNRNASKGDEVQVPWGVFRENRVIRIAGQELYWQPALRDALQYDLVIVNQWNRLLINYVLMVLRHCSRARLALWGHGRNLQTSSTTLGNRMKMLHIRQCDWWFAYTEGVKRIVAAEGFDPDRITVVQNAIDTRFLAEAYANVSVEEVAALKATLGIVGGPVAIFSGGMYLEKRIAFLVSACRGIKAVLPGFHMIFIGAGPDAGLVREFAASAPWVHYVGTKFGRERVPYFKLARAHLMPGLVGLALLDSFAMLTPMVTCQYPFHSPEIEYLNSGYNGLMTADTLEAFVSTTVKLLTDDEMHAHLVQGCSVDRETYTLDAAVNRFAEGVCAALASGVH